MCHLHIKIIHTTLEFITEDTWGLSLCLYSAIICYRQSLSGRIFQVNRMQPVHDLVLDRRGADNVLSDSSDNHPLG